MPKTPFHSKNICFHPNLYQAHTNVFYLVWLNLIYLLGLFKISFNSSYWSTWFVLKIFIKLTTYSMLKARDMEEEAHKWITDWGPIGDPFIEYVFFSVSRIAILFFNQIEAFSEYDYYFINGPLYNCYIKYLIEPPFFILQDISVKILIFDLSFYETFIRIDLGSLVFIFIFFCACRDIFCFYWKKKMKKIYRKVKNELELEYEYAQEDSLGNTK